MWRWPSVGDEPALIKEIEAFLDVLKSENPPGLKWDFQPMPGEAHESIQFRSLEVGLRALVSAWFHDPFAKPPRLDLPH